MKNFVSRECRLKEGFRLTTDVASLNTLIGRDGVVGRANQCGPGTGLEQSLSREPARIRKIRSHRR